MVLSYLLGALSLVGLWVNWTKKKFANIVSYITILFSVVVLYVAKETGTSGGEIRHPEIRSTFKKRLKNPAKKSTRIEIKLSLLSRFFHKNEQIPKTCPFYENCTESRGGYRSKNLSSIFFKYVRWN